MDVQIIKANSSLVDRSKRLKIDRIRVAAYCRVSTDSEEQLNSYRSQVSYYTDLIKKNKEWNLVDIYADEAITGTQVTKRENFQRMINDGVNGQIDMVITKSISRFARNTLDTLRYVRLLKDNNIAVYFEDENINTMTMDGELLLVVLSSVAQQEVENISQNVKKGLKMKMKRGELIGFQGCLGYDYDSVDKTIHVNQEEAKTVKLIFQRYIEGKGATLIKNELNNLGIKSKRGNLWTQSTVLGIIKNEKYKGDVLLGKTFTVDPISKRRLENFGEEDQFYIKDHHEPIVSREMFDRAQELLNRRAKNKSRIYGTPEKREKFSRQYAFSCMLECGFCGSNLSRRSWHSSTTHKKTIWQCVTATKKGKQFCTHSKGIQEKIIEEAFIESYRILCGENRDVLDEFIQRVENTLSESTLEKSLNKIDKDIEGIAVKKKRLLNIRIESQIDGKVFDDKMLELEEKQKKLLDDRIELQFQADNEKILKCRTIEFKKALEKNEVLEEFDRTIFESIVEKVVVGEIDEDGNKNPYKLTFVYKTGISNRVDGKTQRDLKIGKAVKENIKKLSSYISDEVNNLCSQSSIDAR